ncbi:MAG: hypothetical protein JNM07_10350 [Phycisphaerae bacterium]|nr:hypothetical protein [Phycisphaerae bacterium]
MPQNVKPEAPADAIPPIARETLHGWTVDASDEAAAIDALERAFDYRGDVTLRTDRGDLTGYIFDRRRGPTLADSYVRLMLPAGDEKVRVPYASVRRVEFSGKDAAHGKSFETWLKKYVEKKLAGQRASIESEPLEE